MPTPTPSSSNESAPVCDRRPRRRVAAAIVFAATMLAVVFTLIVPSMGTPRSASASAAIVSSPLAPALNTAPAALTGYKWIGRTTIEVYSNWDGGTCILDGASFSGAASSSADSTLAAQLLQASIDDINAQLRGALVLVNAGPVPHSHLCGKSTAEPIVIGWGVLPTETGRTMSYGMSSASTPGVLTFQFARIVLSNRYDFACSDAPAYRDLQHTVTHELLHAIGLGHSQDSTAIMASVSTACRSAYLLQPDDVSGLAALYPPAVSAPAPAPVQGSTASASSTSTAGLLSTPTFSGTGLALAVFRGGTVDQLEAAVAARGGSGAWIQDSTGGFRLLVVGGPSFLRAAVSARFPSGILANTAVTVVR